MKKLFFPAGSKRPPFFKLLQVVITVFLLQCLAPARTIGQSVGDSAALLQNVIDLPQLQPYYPRNQNNAVNPLVIMQHGVSFLKTIAASHNNHALVFKSKAEIINEPAYFLFWRFDINQNSAMIEFKYNYNMNTQSPVAQKGTLIMEKSGNTWTVTNTNIETVQL